MTNTNNNQNQQPQNPSQPVPGSQVTPPHQMSDQGEIQEAVNRAVQTLTNNDELFSAFDVTCLVRKEGIWTDHQTVRNMVGDMFSNDILPQDYIRSSHSFKKDPNAAMVSAYIYHPNWADVNTYDPNKFAEVDSGPFDVDSRGRFCVRTSLVGKLGQPLQYVHVETDPQGHRLIIHPPSHKQFTATRFYLRIERNGDVRISRKMLNTVSPTAMKFKVRKVGDTLHVTA